jgi:hypothetical protein
VQFSKGVSGNSMLFKRGVKQNQDSADVVVVGMALGSDLILPKTSPDDANFFGK